MPFPVVFGSEPVQMAPEIQKSSVAPVDMEFAAFAVEHRDSKLGIC